MDYYIDPYDNGVNMRRALDDIDRAWPSFNGAIDFLYHNEVVIQQRTVELSHEENVCPSCLNGRYAARTGSCCTLCGKYTI